MCVKGRQKINTFLKIYENLVRWEELQAVIQDVSLLPRLKQNCTIATEIVAWLPFRFPQILYREFSPMKTYAGCLQIPASFRCTEPRANSVRGRGFHLISVSTHQHDRPIFERRLESQQPPDTHTHTRECQDRLAEGSDSLKSYISVLLDR